MPKNEVCERRAQSAGQQVPWSSSCVFLALTPAGPFESPPVRRGTAAKGKGRDPTVRGNSQPTRGGVAFAEARGRQALTVALAMTAPQKRAEALGGGGGRGSPLKFILKRTQTRTNTQKRTEQHKNAQKTLKRTETHRNEQGFRSFIAPPKAHLGPFPTLQLHLDPIPSHFLVGGTPRSRFESS